jgi:hypothetical protein
MCSFLYVICVNGLIMQSKSYKTLEDTVENNFVCFDYIIYINEEINSIKLK